MRAVLTLQQLAAIIRIKPPTAAGIQQVISARHPQQEMPGEVHADQRNLQTARQFQGYQGQAQWLAATGLQHLVQQCDLRAQRQKSSWANPRSFIRRSNGCASSLTGSIGKP